jgi:hypothetical protein
MSPITSPPDLLRPHLRRTAHATQLVVNGRPMLLTAGEVRNSASSSREWMQHVWDKCVRSQLNTVLAVVPWDMMEPEEGQYDFSVIDYLIEDARIYGMSLVPLWFGAWKNGLSHYIPSWVKTDTKRFPRARATAGNTEILSPMGTEARDATARAYAALMARIRERDAGTHTVTMMQVENEVGFNGDIRDRSDIANAAWAGQVPEALMRHLVENRDRLLPETLQAWVSRRDSGTWKEVFGEDETAGRVFMSWYYATFIEKSAAAGKAEYEIPMFVNASLASEANTRRRAGPSGVGGPRAQVLDIWQAGAPSIDMLSPDIYRSDYEAIYQEFNRQGNPMFIPEAPAELEGAASAFYSVGQGAIGYSPFGIEERVADHDNGPIRHAYALLNRLAPVILEHQANGTITSARVSRSRENPAEVKLAPRVNPDQPVQTFVFGGYKWVVRLNHYWRSPDWPFSDWGYCIVMQTGDDEFLIAGYGVQIHQETLEDDGNIVALLSVDEVDYENGRWLTRRRLNGDEIITSYDHATLLAQRQTGTEIKFWEPTPQAMRVKLYTYPR